MQTVARPHSIQTELERWGKKLNLHGSDLSYLASLYSQYRNPKPAGDLEIGMDFFPSALLSPEDREDLLGAVEYRRLVEKKKEYASQAMKTVLVLHPMNGGIGTSLKRESYLRGLWSELGRKAPVVLGAKGSDLFFKVRVQGQDAVLSISEAKILRAVNERGRYRQTVLQELASTETEASVRLLLDGVNLYGRLGAPSPWGEKTYREIFKTESRLRLDDTLIQAALPTVDEKGELTDRRIAPGGHGQWGVRLLLRALETTLTAKDAPLIAAIYNEDGLNNTVDPVIVGWMAKERVPAVMISTVKTPLDKKGGQLGIIRLRGGAVRKELLEEAQAAARGQGRLFLEMGLTEGEKGAQYFNTNTVLLNYTVLSPFLKDLADLIGKDKLCSVLSPSLIQNRKKQKENGAEKEYIQLEGALGSSLINLDTFLSTSTDPAVKKLLKSHRLLKTGGAAGFLRIVNIDAAGRTKFFTPVKNAFDFWLQFYSDLYRVSPETWELESLKPGFIPPVALSGYYEDVSSVLGAFGTPGAGPGPAGVIDLDSLEIQGKVKLAGAVLKGRVRILSRSSEVVDLNSAENKRQLGLTSDKGLALENIVVAVSETGNIVVDYLLPPVPRKA